MVAKQVSPKEESLHQDGPLLKKQRSENDHSIEQDSKRGKKREKKPKDCRHWNPDQGRKCTNKAVTGFIYCQEHNVSGATQKPKPEKKPVLKDSETSTRTKKNGSIISRVPCPIDPSHTVWEDRLAKHVRHCNAVKKVVELEQKAESCEWFEIDFNVRDSPMVPKIEISNADNEEVDKATEKVIFEQKFLKFVAKLNTIYDKFIGSDNDLELVDVPEVTGLKSRFEEVTNQKHIIQQSALIGHLIKNGLFDSKNTYVEFGCGRAEFSRYLVKSLMNSDDEVNTENYKLLLVDRSSQKMKFDTKITKDYKEFYEGKRDIEDIQLPIVHRCKVDIKDLKLQSAFKFNTTSDKTKFVGISKHLCGVATDLTLRSILNCQSENVQFGGLLVAMCCRHVCNFNWLLADSKVYLTEKLGITRDEFDSYMVKMASWATNGLTPGHSGDDGADRHFTKLSYNQREAVGLKVRRIIDESRVYALTQRGFECQLAKYVDKSISLENTCLVVLPGNSRLVNAKSNKGDSWVSRCCIV